MCVSTLGVLGYMHAHRIHPAREIETLTSSTIAACVCVGGDPGGGLGEVEGGESGPLNRIHSRIGAEHTLQKILSGWVDSGQQAFMSSRMDSVSGSAKRVSA